MNSQDKSTRKKTAVKKGNKNPAPSNTGWFRKSFSPFRIATLRGLGILLPPLLTIMLFAWAWSTIERAILLPVESLSETTLAYAIEDIRSESDIKKETADLDSVQERFKQDVKGRLYTSLDGTLLIEFNHQWLPFDIFEMVSANPGTANLSTAHDYYKRYVQLKYLKRHLIIPAFLAIFLGAMYIVGKLLAAGIGRFFWHQFESLINRLPIIRNVYSSVKQVTDFAFSETDVQFTRVVAVEYPRRGIWSIGFVTGESMLDIRRAAGEPILSVLMPTSPMPATGFTISIPKSETVDLDITIDQAIQYCVSCGVVVPDHQAAKTAIEGKLHKKNENKPQLKDNDQAID